MDSEIAYHRQLNGATELLEGLSIDHAANQEESKVQDTSLISGNLPNDHQNRDKYKAKFNKLIQRAKEVGRQGQLEEALRLFEEAYDIHQSVKLQKRIQTLKEAIETYKEEDEDSEDEEDDGMREVGNGFSIPTDIHQALYPYQLEGVLWFWQLYQQKRGGILGDDMGLGKTIQVISFLAGMFDAELIKSVLIVMPVSLMPNWEKEFSKWAPGIRVKTFHGSNKKERMRNLEKIQRRTGVCLTTYGLIVSSHESLGSTSSTGTFTWDYIILDEGHKIKNTTKTSKNIREIPAKYHFILTGTPIQNNLREMWALFDFACEGKLLGTSRTFKQEYEGPIVRARERDASAYEKRIGKEMSESLRKLIEPYFLRRTKAMVLEKKKQVVDGTDGPEENKENRTENSVKAPGKLTRKNDFIVWLFMSQTQLKIYSDFLGLERVKEMLMSTKSPLAELNVLKKICDHPRLLSALACEQLGLDDEARLVEMDSAEELEGLSIATQPKGLGPSDKVLIQESGKMVFLVALLENLKSEGHRCLIFSQSRKMLDIIQRVLSHMGHKILRIDGTITSTAERQHLINTFQSDSAYSCFLLTTQVGGVGITLTAADRVVIFDPSWNPATDAQAVDRAYRIGQKKTVVIYRLITCGTLEEKIYRKQIFKDALMKQTTGVSKNPFRYFSRQDLRDLFTLDAPHTSKTQLQLASMHAHHRKTDEQLDKHIQFLHTLDIFGITDHDLMYSQEDVETPEEMDEFSGHDSIQARVLRAQNLMAAEAGIPHPPRTTPALIQSMAFPQGLRQSLPLNQDNPTARQKIQATIDNERFIEPKRQDTKRFQPSQFIQHVSPNLSPASPVVVDLTQSPSVPSPVEIHNDSPVQLAVTDEQKEGEELGREFESLHIEHTEHVPSPYSAPRVSPQETIYTVASVHSPIADQDENVYAEKKASRRRKSMSQRLELPEIDDSDDDDDDSSQEPEIAVISDSRENSVVEQDDTAEESTSSIGSKHNFEVELDSGEVVIGQSFDKNAESSDDESAHGSHSVSSPEPSTASRTIDERIARTRRMVGQEDERNDNRHDVINDDVIISGKGCRNDSIVDGKHQGGVRQIGINVEGGQISNNESEGSGDEESTYETDSLPSPETVMDPSSKSTGSGTHSSSEYETRIQRIAQDEDEMRELSESSPEGESSGDESDDIDVIESEDESTNDGIADARQQGALLQGIIKDVEGNNTSEYGQVNGLQHEDAIEIPPHTRRIRRIVSDDTDNGYYESTEKLIHQNTEYFNDGKIERIQSDDDSENEADVKSSTERLSDTLSPQTDSFLGDVENSHVRNATGSNSETGSQLSSAADSDESQSHSSSSRGEFDDASPEPYHVIRPRVRRIVSSGDEDEEEGDGEFSVKSAERRCKDLNLAYNGKENKSAETKSQERSRLSFQSRYENSPSTMTEHNSLPKEKVPCPTGQHVSDVIEIHKCACVTSETEKSKYLLYIDNGRKLELEGNGVGACAQYMAALGLMDSDFELHKKILELAEIMKLPS